MTYRRLYLDTNAKYEFKLTSIFGKSMMMVGFGNKQMSLSDDLSYSYIVGLFEDGEQSSIIVEPP